MIIEDTPLYFAAGSGHLDIVQYLIDNGANVYLKNKNGETSLHYAAKAGHLNIVYYLVNNVANLDIMNETFFCVPTPIDLALKNGFTEIARLLFKKQGSYLNGIDSNKQYLHWVSEYGYIDIAKDLLKANFDINAKSIIIELLSLEKPLFIMLQALDI